MPEITWEDKTNPHPIVDRTKQATAEDFKETKTAVNAIYQGVTENHYAFKGASEFEEGTLFYSVVNGRNESSIPFYAPTLTSDVGTIELGSAITIKVGGENVNFTDEIDNETFNPVWIQQGIDNKPYARLTPDEAETIEYELSKAEVLVNPVWIVDIVKDHRSIGYSVETDTTIENCTFYASKEGIPFYQAEFGTLEADVEKFVDLENTPGLTPVDVLAGQSYSITITSPDGDVRLKGSDALQKPFFVATVLPSVDAEVPTDRSYAMESISTSTVYGGKAFRESDTTFYLEETLVRVSAITQATGKTTVKHYIYPETHGITPPDLLTRVSTRLAISALGALVQAPFTLTDTFIRENAVLGYILHPNGIIEDSDNSIFNDILKQQELYSQFVDSLETLGVTRKKGCSVTLNADMTFNISSGILQAPGAGVGSGQSGQNYRPTIAYVPAVFKVLLGTTDDLSPTEISIIDPGFYDNGSGTPEPLSQPTNAQIIYIYMGIGGKPTLMLGQTEYPDIEYAVLNADTDVVVFPEEIDARANLIGRIVLTRNCTSLQNTETARFLQGVRFGAGLSGVSFGAGSGGGDMSGPASAALNEIFTAGDTTGKVAVANSNISALNSILQSLFIGGDLKLERNGDGRIILGNAANLPTPNVNNKVVIHTASGANGLEVSTGSENSVWLQFTIDNIREGSVGVNNGRRGIGLYDGFDVNAASYAELSAEGFNISTKKMAVNTPDAPRGVVQANKKPTDVGSFTDDLDCPIVGHVLTDNGGSTPAAPEPAAVFTRAGVSAESFANILSVMLSRYENSETNARTQVDFRLSHGALTSEGNDGPIILSLKSNGDVRLGDFLFLANGEIKLQEGEEIRFDGYVVTGGFTTLDIEERTHIIGELFHNVDTNRIQQFIGDTGQVENVGVGDVISDAFPGTTNKLVAYANNNVIKDSEINITKVNDNLITITPDEGIELKLIPDSAAFPITVGDAKFTPLQLIMGGPLPSPDAIASFIGSGKGVCIPYGTEAERAAITPANFMLRGNTTTKNLDFFYDGWKVAGKRSFNIILGNELGFTATAPVNFPDIPTYVAVKYYKIDGQSGSVGDYDGITFTLPTNAPTGLYRLSVSCFTDLLQGIDTLTGIDAQSYARIYMKRNGETTGFQPGANFRMPQAKASPYQYSMSDTIENWLQPGDQIQPRIDIVTGPAMPDGHDWSLTQMKFELAFVGKE